MFTITYHPKVVSDDIPGLPKAWRAKVKTAIEKKLVTHPDLYGKPLRRSLAGYRKLRVGDYRLIFRLTDTTVKVLIIHHRSIVYDVVRRRL